MDKREQTRGEEIANAVTHVVRSHLEFVWTSFGINRELLAANCSASC